MGSREGRHCLDLWSEIINSEGGEHQRQPQQPQIEEIYRRRRPPAKTNQDVTLDLFSGCSRPNLYKVSLAAGQSKGIGWSRSLSTRGRTSIAIGACVENQHQQKQTKRKGRPALPKGKQVHPPNFEKERAYFQDVDAFELLEESPSPQNFGTWAMGNEFESVVLPPLTSRLEKWLISKKFNHSLAPSTALSMILETPVMQDHIGGNAIDYSYLKTPEKSHSKNNSLPFQYRQGSGSIDNDVLARHIDLEDGCIIALDAGTDSCEDIEVAVKKLSIASTSASSNHLGPFNTLLAVCGQSSPSKFKDVFSTYCDPKTIVKVGEGTYGEAFKAGNTVCKIVPIDGDLRVNGEVQKRSEELLEEAILSRALNYLRRCDDDNYNSISTFIETIDLRVCQGSYDAALIKAWEDWDEKHDSENDNPKEFPEKQCYVMFVLQDGGKDLESFVLMNFDEARSLLVQVTAALAVAEAANEFEHRDLHWGNILLRRNDSLTLRFTLDGKHMIINTFGLTVSIIDFTLSRINTGEDVLFLDLSSDPDLFKGPKGDKQSETYRKMKEVTGGCWEGSFPRTNVLWLLYLVDVLLLKKSFERNSKIDRELRSLKKRLDSYESAKEAIFDPFFNDLIVDEAKLA